MKKMRVLHVIKTLALGGAETNLLNLVQAMDPEHVENHVAYSWGGEIEERFKKQGIRLFKYADAQHSVKSLATLSIVAKLATYILKNRIDVVHTHVFNAHVWGAAAAKLTGRKVVEHVHDFRYIDRAEREKGHQYVEQFRYVEKVQGLSDGIIVLTSQNRDFILQHNYSSSEKVWLIRNGIPQEKEGTDAKRSSFPEGRKVFLTPARLSGEKNLELLFQIVPRVARECPEALFIICGDGPLLEEYKNWASHESFSPWLKFIGFQPDVKRLLASSYAMVLPSLLELHPIAALEALSMKVPVLLSENVGCHSEIFTNGKNALLLDPHSPESWAEAILHLAKDEKWRDELGENGYQLCQEQFDIRDVAGRIEGVYENVLQK